MICTTYFLTFFSELIPPTGNKSIAEILYNVLNLPQTLKISSAMNTYTYPTDGGKLKMAHTILPDGSFG